MSGHTEKPDSFQSWVTVPTLPAKEGYLTNFCLMEPKIGSASPTTTLSIGMESLGDSENAKDFTQQPASKLKSVSWAHLKERTNSAHEGGDLDGLKDYSFTSGAKRKRAVSFDLTANNEFREVSFQEESDIVLALGQMGGCSQNKNIVGVGKSMGEGLGRGIDGNWNMVLGNSQLENYFESSGGSCTEELFDAVSVPRIASEDCAQPLRRAASSFVQKNFASESDLLLRLGNLRHDNGSREGSGFSVYTSQHFRDERTEASSEVPLGLGLFGSPNENLSLGESISFSGLREGENYGGSFLGLGQTKHQIDIVCEQVPQPVQIPVVDEGSSSARWLKSGGFMPSLLKSSQLQQDAQNTVAIDRLESNDAVAAHHQGLIEPEFSISVRPSSGTTSTSGASGSRDRICKFRGCCKGGRGTSGLCIAHGGGRRCQKQGCSKGAEGRTVYCKAHGGGRRCQNLGCTKSAEGKTDYCIGHGGGRRCNHEGCLKAARGRSGLCIRHGGGKRCQKEGCTKSAEGYTGLCISHGGGRRCQFEGCTKGAQGSTKFCKGHGGGKRCIILGCNKGAEGSTPLCKGHGGGKRCMFQGGGICTKSVHGGTLFCVAHGGGKRCAVPGCSKSARGRTDSCVRHGGGKRCKIEGCGKSAQGSTDFCKAHGGGKRCTWGQEGSAYGPNLFKEGIGEFSKTVCDRFARGRLGLCAAHSALVQDQRVHGSNHGISSFGHGISPGLFRGLVSGSVQSRASTGQPMSSEVTLSTSYGPHVPMVTFSSNYSSHVFSNNMEGAGPERLEGLDSSNEMSKGSVAMNVTSFITNEDGWAARVADGRESVMGGEFVQSRISDSSSLNLSASVHGAETDLPGLGSPLPFTFKRTTAPRGVVSSGQKGLSPNAPENMDMNSAPSPSTSILQSFPRSLIPPQVLVPQLMKQKVTSPTTHPSSSLLEGGSHGIGSSFMREGRVHGGSFLAMLASEAAEKDET
ncbi:hypothetical protein O6H91_03G112600 [Diphasiastrum complanatum]|uniref:Uncharacterized protein n=3 Tax=Diphasiastrum complanatum TaxID=34168 RepID=A0ACC2EA60_DIPCM|nr:hypothetical protein O6H91_03G112600 [Diphasiastrum complanatum]KAJ7563489.1 hypothetical protein O6H91_03G112600 [Diphasiastrum complanatum]KAJ7563490.1 hypothetical protein O6H91_03G112600 [Diphasiastrum complanatum]